MPRVAEGRPAAEPQSAGQRARRLRILDAAAQLGSERELERVQMHHVAQQADVAIGTLYRYFPSKTHLFVGVMADRIERMYERFTQQERAAGDAADRVFDVLVHATRALLRTPKLANAMIQSNNSADAAVITEAARIDELVRRILLEAAGIEQPSTEEFALIRVVEQAWYGVLQSSLNGRLSVPDAEGDLRLACRLLLHQLTEAEQEAPER